MRADNAYYKGELVRECTERGWDYSISLTHDGWRKPVLEQLEGLDGAQAVSALREDELPPGLALWGDGLAGGARPAPGSLRGIPNRIFQTPRARGGKALARTPKIPRLRRAILHFRRSEPAQSGLPERSRSLSMPESPAAGAELQSGEAYQGIRNEIDA